MFTGLVDVTLGIQAVGGTTTVSVGNGVFVSATVNVMSGVGGVAV
jgi:hypothetical protein